MTIADEETSYINKDDQRIPPKGPFDEISDFRSTKADGKAEERCPLSKKGGSGPDQTGEANGQTEETIQGNV